MSKLFKLVVDTEQYSGNFEREMCAYITGQVGECGVGDNWVDNYASTIIHLDWWNNHIVNRPDDSDSPCYRPVSIYPTLGWGNNVVMDNIFQTINLVKTLNDIQLTCQLLSLLMLFRHFLF